MDTNPRQRQRPAAPAWPVILAALFAGASGSGAPGELVANPGIFPALTEPPCSYIANQNLKGMVQPSDRVLAWIRGAHNGGAFPLRHFIAGQRVVNDTYGLFFYDPDGGYVSAFEKDYGYEFMAGAAAAVIVRGADGTLWSALTGVAIEGPKAGQRLKRLPSLLTTWGLWLMLHPESTAYDLFDGATYRPTDLPVDMHPDARRSLGTPDPRLAPTTPVLGVEVGGTVKAYALADLAPRACYTDTAGGQPLAVFWYGPTQSAVAFSTRLDDRTLNFYADAISPETAPFKDQETGTRWTLAGRGVDGPLPGRELTWLPSLQCRWFAWAAEYPKTELHTGKAQAPE